MGEAYMLRACASDPSECQSLVAYTEYLSSTGSHRDRIRVLQVTCRLGYPAACRYLADTGMVGADVPYQPKAAAKLYAQVCDATYDAPAPRNRRPRHPLYQQVPACVRAEQLVALGLVGEEFRPRTTPELAVELEREREQSGGWAPSEWPTQSAAALLERERRETRAFFEQTPEHRKAELLREREHPSPLSVWGPLAPCD
jgi:hypothetical protein